jgi:hypothetical protein
MMPAYPASSRPTWASSVAAQSLRQVLSDSLRALGCGRVDHHDDRGAFVQETLLVGARVADEFDLGGEQPFGARIDCDPARPVGRDDRQHRAREQHEPRPADGRLGERQKEALARLELIDPSDRAPPARNDP